MDNFDDFVDKAGNRMFFVSKADLLKTVSSIFESLLDMAFELDLKKLKIEQIIIEMHQIKKQVEHLRNILLKDLILTEDSNTAINLMKIKMSKSKWNDYIKRDQSDSGSDGSAEVNS